MIIDGLGLQQYTATLVATVFVRLLKWVCGAELLCRECGATIPAAQMRVFTEQGCLFCGSRKLSLEGADGRRPWILLIKLGVSLVLIVLLFGSVPVGCDYPIFRAAAQAVAAGTSRLYDAGAPGFFYAPWSLAIFGPLSQLPDATGSTLINAASIMGIGLSVWVLTGPTKWWMAIFAMFGNIAVINLVAAAQWDGLILTAVVLTWWAIQQEDAPLLTGLALTFIGTKPTNAILPTLVVLAVGWRQWGGDWKRWGTMAIIPSLALLSAVIISGWDWPVRYLAFIQASPPNAGYNLADMLHWGPLHLGGVVLTVALTLVAGWRAVKNSQWAMVINVAFLLNLLLSPYVTIYHYVTTIPLAVQAGKRDSLWLAGLYIAGVLWMTVQPLTPIYPLSLAIAALFTVPAKAHHAG